jgi:hypothetical protein
MHRDRQRIGLSDDATRISRVNGRARLTARARALAATAAIVVLAIGGLAPRVAAQTPDKSDVVLVFDFSASILTDKTNRNRFAEALNGIAGRVATTSKDLVLGDTTVSFVVFASKAVDVRSCTDLHLLGSAATVTKFAQCLQSIAGLYRSGPSKSLQGSIGIDTNYVAAMGQAAHHLPANAERPALILFTDGKHDVPGVPATAVIPTRDQLFGKQSSFALLPVGMGLDPALRAELTARLEELRVVKNMPACVSGQTFDWPTVVFSTAADAGTAVGTALADATCTFTVAPTPVPSPTPTPPTVQGIQVKAGDGQLDIVWSAPSASKLAITDYKVRCGTGDGTWIEAPAGSAKDRTATISGLANGTAYQCQVAAVAGTSVGPWTPAAATVTPIGKPGAPPKPTVAALDAAVSVAVPAASSGVDRFQYECSSDNGATWTTKVDSPANDPATTVTGLTNGSSYTCRAYAQNAIGVSDPGPVSDAVRPCSGSLQCNPLMVPLLSGIGVLLALALLAAAIVLLRGRPTGYVIAVADVVHTANIGHGRNLGIAFTRDASKRVTGIVADKGKDADVRIRRLRGGTFELVDRIGTHRVGDGDPVVVADSVGVRHSLVLRAFATNAASQVASRRR